MFLLIDLMLEYLGNLYSTNIGLPALANGYIIILC